MIISVWVTVTVTGLNAAGPKAARFKSAACSKANGGETTPDGEGERVVRVIKTAILSGEPLLRSVMMISGMAAGVGVGFGGWDCGGGDAGMGIGMEIEMEGGGGGEGDGWGLEEGAEGEEDLDVWGVGTGFLVLDFEIGELAGSGDALWEGEVLLDLGFVGVAETDFFEELYLVTVTVSLGCGLGILEVCVLVENVVGCGFSVLPEGWLADDAEFACEADPA